MKTATKTKAVLIKEFEELKVELLLRQKSVTITDPTSERLSDHISERQSANPQHEFPKDDLWRVMGVGNNVTPKHGKLLVQVTRQYGLIEVKRGSREKRVRLFVPEKAAGTGDA